MDERFDVLLFGTDLTDVSAGRFLEEALASAAIAGGVGGVERANYSEAVRFAGLGATDYLPADRLNSLDWVDERMRIADLRRGSEQCPGIDQSVPRLVVKVVLSSTSSSLFTSSRHAVQLF